MGIPEHRNIFLEMRLISTILQPIFPTHYSDRLAMEQSKGYSDEVVHRVLLFIAVCLPPPHKVGNGGSGSAQTLNVYCNEYGQTVHLGRLLEVVIEKYNASALLKVFFRNCRSDSKLGK